MTLETAHKLNVMERNPGSGHYQNTAKSVSGGVMREYGQAAVNSLIREVGLEELWDIQPGTKPASAVKS